MRDIEDLQIYKKVPIFAGFELRADLPRRVVGGKLKNQPRRNAGNWREITNLNICSKVPVSVGLQILDWRVEECSGSGADEVTDCTVTWRR